MTDIQKSALERIKNDYKNKPDERYANVIASPVRDALSEFCKQEPEFADFVLTSKKTVADCIRHIAGEISGKNAVSDHDVYEMAARYFFPTARVIMTPAIDLTAGAGDMKKTSIADLSFDDLFGGD